MSRTTSLPSIGLINFNVANLSTTALICLGLSACNKSPAPAAPHRETIVEAFRHKVVEGYPTETATALQQRSAETSAAGSVFGGERADIIVTSARHWKPGQAVRVAFQGGTPDLYAKIESAASEWTKPGLADMKLDFHTPAGGWRVWKPQDKNYSAEIRIAFVKGDDGGFWSLVGTDSIDPTIKGGSPGQPSMNLQAFDSKPPADWHSIILHEFGHAIGFEHEHQSPKAGCDFRFDDDPGYQKTQDAEGWYVNDKQGRRPGLYTYLGGYSNFWKPGRVDFNLMALPASSAFHIGPYDPKSIMMYHFEPIMFKAGVKSKCYTPRENDTLSSQDQAGVHQAYLADPSTGEAPSIVAMHELTNSSRATPNLKRRLRAAVVRLEKLKLK